MAAATNTETSKKPTWKGWGAVPKVEVFDSLQDVMSEQLALEIAQNASIDDVVPNLPPEKTEIPPHLLLDEDVPFLTAGKDDTSNDFLLAMMLQHEFDQEHDVMLKREQDKMNGGSKVVVSYNNHRVIHPSQRSEVDFDESLLNVPEVKMPKDPSPCFNKQGISGKGKNVVTKHDAKINGIKNALKVMDTFPPEFETGNGLDMAIPNKVFNKLKMSSKVETKRSQKHHEKKEHSTQLVAIDEKTKLLLYKLENSGTVENLNGVISTGKEAIVFHAKAGDFKGAPANKELAVKVYKTTLGKFKNRCLYVKGDMRFIKDDFKKQNPRKIMRIWAEKEEMNLRRMQRFSVPCPEAFLTKKHVLVMSFIGSNGVAAPKLQEVIFTDKELESAYKQCIDIMRKMYAECHLVHADLSEFNMLWHEGVVYVIDVAQSVDASQSKALEFLMRDCLNVTKFFQSRGLENTMSWQELFNDITGMNASGEGEEFLSQIVKRADDEATLTLDETKREFPFDFFFEKSCKEKDAEQDSNSGSDYDDDD